MKCSSVRLRPRKNGWSVRPSEYELGRMEELFVRPTRISYKRVKCSFVRLRARTNRRSVRSSVLKIRRAIAHFLRSLSVRSRPLPTSCMQHKNKFSICHLKQDIAKVNTMHFNLLQLRWMRIYFNLDSDKWILYISSSTATMTCHTLFAIRFQAYDGDDELSKGIWEIQKYNVQKNNKKQTALYEQLLHVNSARPHSFVRGRYSGSVFHWGASLTLAK